ncbi:MAG: DUF1292 domain-containing protein [Clostridia bacterium]|nr:DUF1292 domain-containing protein [Clostridia bacterium]
MSQDFEAPDIVSVFDEYGVEHYFEELKRIETDTGKYVALLPYYSDDGSIIEEDFDEDDDGIIILKVLEKGKDVFLEDIADPEELEDVVGIFTDVLAEEFDIKLEN